MNIIFKCKFGSHLYGTNTPESDLDYKGIFIEDIDNIILKKDKHVVIKKTGKDDTRNTKDDIDIEYKELREFLKDCMDGQTYALDMLFVPEEFVLKTSDEWKFIQKYRKKLLSRNVAPFIGYCRQQAGKYGLKGSRMGELERVLSIAKKREFFPESKKARLIEDILPEISLSEYVRLTEHTDREGRTNRFLEVIGKKFNYNIFVKEMVKVLQTCYDRYGKRAIEAKNNNGVDWKAISHAFRCMYELDELARTGEIKFPLKQAEYLKEIKQGKLEYKTLAEELARTMDKVIKFVENNSKLPKEPDRDFWEEHIAKEYKRQVMEGLNCQ